MRIMQIGNTIAQDKAKNNQKIAFGMGIEVDTKSLKAAINAISTDPKAKIDAYKSIMNYVEYTGLHLKQRVKDGMKEVDEDFFQNKKPKDAIPFYKVAKIVLSNFGGTKKGRKALATVSAKLNRSDVTKPSFEPYAIKKSRLGEFVSSIKDAISSAVDEVIFKTIKTSPTYSKHEAFEALRKTDPQRAWEQLG